MKKTVKILSIVIMTVMIVASMSQLALAAIEPASVTGNTSADTTGILNIGNSIIGVIKAIGTVISVGILVVLGIKYMVGSAEEKAEYKKSMIPYLVGAILLFAATWIASAIYTFANGMKN